MSATTGNRTRRKGRATAVIGYVLGVIGLGALAGVFWLLYDFDRTNDQRDGQLSDLQSQLESVQTELGRQKQENAVLSNRIIDLEEQLGQSSSGRLIADRVPSGGGDVAAGSDSAAIDGPEQTLAGGGSTVADLREELLAQQSRLADLEAKARAYDVLERDAGQMAGQIQALRAELDQLGDVAEKYTSLQQRFEEQAEQLASAGKRLEAFKKQLDDRTATRVVSRTSLPVTSDAPSTTIVRRTPLPEITSLPPLSTTYPSGSYSSGTIITSYPPPLVVPYPSTSYYAR